ncbi:MAG: hypothetical protein ABJA34_03685 [Pseudonocardiales bacterium]
MSKSAITELRVHGVSGTPPEAILLRPHVRRIAGDSRAGFFRPGDGASPTDGEGGPRLEAYSWGNLTSGASSRALWLLLLPAMLSNLAPWMRPRRARPGDPRRVAAAEGTLLGLCRVLALTLTATVMLTAVGLVMDLVAWQCTGPGRACGARRSYLSWLGHGWWSEPGRRLAVGAVGPLLTIGLLWYLGHRTWQRYESRPAAEGVGAALADPGFWYGRHLVGRLRLLHVVVALATVTGSLVWPVLAQDRHRGDPAAGRAVFGSALLVLVGLLVCGCAVAVWLPGVVRRDAAGRVVALPVLRALALFSVPAAVGYAVLPRPGWASAGALPGFTGSVIALFSAQMVLLVLLTVATAVLRGRRLPYPVAMAGFGTPIVAAMALFLASAFSAGASFRIADWLDGRAVPSSAAAGAAAERLQPPQSYAWAGFGFFFGCVALVILGVLIRFWLQPRLVARTEQQVRADFGLGPHDSPDRVRQIAEVAGAASLTDRGGTLLTLVFVPGALAALAVTVLVLVWGKGPVDLVAANSRPAMVLSLITNTGAYLIGVFAISLVVVGRMAYRTAKTRRLVGIAWDLGTFWPRDAHPLAPPCYAERSVPDLVTRVCWLGTGDGEQPGVILAGHSQGSVLVAATMLQLPPDVLARVAVLTYGSPLTRLYGAFFPAYFCPPELAGVRDAVTGEGQAPRWTNLYFETDPIGGPVLPEIDRRLLPTSSFTRPAGDTADPPVFGHSDYPASPGFAESVRTLAAALQQDRTLDLPGGTSADVAVDG